MFSEKIDQLIEVLERQELESTSGIVSAQLYAELFTAYLYKNDLCSARFLWKRIPQNVKSSNVELDKIYTVFNHLWHNNISGFFKAINHEWSNNVAELMFELKEKTYNQTIDLISKAYTSIFEDRLCDMLNQTSDVITELCKSLDWEIQGSAYPRLILPKRKPMVIMQTETSENLLAKLTDFVSFLEN